MKIVWTIKASEDLVEIYNYLAAHTSPENAKKFIKKIMRRVLGLQFMPYLGAVEPRLTKLKRDYRRLIVKPYKIIYDVRKEKIYIHRIFDSRQNPDALKVR